MSFIKKYLLEPKEIAKQIIDSPKMVYMTNVKVDAFMGSPESIIIIDEFITAYEEDPKQDFSSIISKYTN